MSVHNLKKYGKWAVVAYVAQALVGIAVGTVWGVYTALNGGL